MSGFRDFFYICFGLASVTCKPLFEENLYTNCFNLRTERLSIVDVLGRPVVGGDTFSRPPPVLSPPQIKVSM